MKYYKPYKYMQILDSNQKHILIRHNGNIYLVCSQTFAIISTNEQDYVLGSLQYGTGIAALCQESFITIYDMKYQQQKYKIDTFLKVINIWLIKNLLITVADERIFIYDLFQKQKLCYIPTYKGISAFINEDYYRLKIFYHQSANILIDRNIWQNQNKQIQNVKFDKGIYMQEGKVVCLVLENLLSLYKDQQLIRVFSFQTLIHSLKQINGSICILEQCGNVFYVKKSNDIKKLIKFTQITKISDNKLVGECKALFFTKQKINLIQNQNILSITYKNIQQSIESMKESSKVLKQCSQKEDEQAPQQEKQ